jgi:hypothetical protein
MKIKITLLALGLMAVSTPAFADDQAKKDTKVCKDITALDTSLDNFEDLPDTATIAELRAAESRVERSVQALAKSAQAAYPEQVKALQTAEMGFDQAIEDAPPDATLDQIETTLDTKREKVREAYDALLDKVDC